MNNFQRKRMFDKSVCDVSMVTTENEEYYDFDVTCNHPRKPEHPSSLALEDSISEVTFRFPLVDMDMHPDKVSGETPRESKIREDLEMVIEDLKDGSFSACERRPIGWRLTERDEFHPHVRCISKESDFDSISRDVSQAGRNIRERYDFKQIPQ